MGAAQIEIPDEEYPSRRHADGNYRPKDKTS
jgi:hypothetical protein